MSKTYRDLLIWQHLMSLVTRIYELTVCFPQSEVFGLTSQIRRAAVSIPCNISEGYGRKSKLEFNRFLNFAMGSLFEVQTQLEIALNLKYLDKVIFEGVFESTREIERMLSSFKKSLV